MAEEQGWWDRYGQKLRDPFPAGQIGHLPKGGVRLDYVGHAAVTDRLLKVDPVWTWNPVAYDENGLPRILFDEARGKAVLWIQLTVGGLTRIGVGTVDSSKPDLEKELISDALRNAAMRFGVALDLWAKEDLAADEPARAEPKGKKKEPVQLDPDESAKQDWQFTAQTLLESDPVGWHETLGRIEEVFQTMANAGIWSPKALGIALEGKSAEQALKDLDAAAGFWGKTRTAAVRDLAKRAG